MSWASNRQSKYLLGIFAFCGLIVLAFLYPTLTKAPTCFDGKQNGGEHGVDCGGACSRQCSSEVSDPLILWSRAFNVSGSTYNLVGFVENQNKDSAVAVASYEFKVYDTNNTLIGVRTGTTFIPPNQQFAVFESRFDSGQSTVKSISFGFTGPLVWVKKAPTLQTLPISVGNVLLGDNPNSPTLTADVTNDSIYSLPAFDVVTILYDSNHNAITASKTHSDGLDSNTSTPVLFTWPEPFSQTVATKDVIIEINPFTTQF